MAELLGPGSEIRNAENMQTFLSLTQLLLFLYYYYK